MTWSTSFTPSIPASDINSPPSQITGNRYFTTATIRERLSITPASWVEPNGRFSQKMLTDDVASIKALYFNNGFLAVKIDTELMNDLHGKKEDIAVKIGIDEGPQTRVADLQIVGNQRFQTSLLQSFITNLPGQPYSEANLINDRDAHHAVLLQQRLSRCAV